MLRSLEELRPPGYDLVVFSPHLDDAVLSCGGEIALLSASGRKVLVVTVFSGGSRSGQPARGAFAAFADMEARRAEDARAMALLGCDHLWLGYEEAPARDRRYASPLRLISRPLAVDRPLMAELVALVRRLAEASPKAEILFPLGVGGHVDHRILYDVSRSASFGLSRYYEEIPYSHIPFALELRLRGIGASAARTASLPDSTNRLPALETARRASEGILSVPAIRGEIAAWQIPLLRALVALVVLRHCASRRLRPSGRGGVDTVPHLVDVTAGAPWKSAAAAEYGSQMPVLFSSLDAYRDASLAYSRRIGGSEGQMLERRWTIRPVPARAGQVRA